MSVPPLTTTELAEANRYFCQLGSEPTAATAALRTLDDFILSLSPADLVQLVRFVQLMNDAEDSAAAAGLSPLSAHVVAAIRVELELHEHHAHTDAGA